MSCIRSTAVLLLTLAACDDPVARVAAPDAAGYTANLAVVDAGAVQLDFTLPNPCTGETVHWQGPLHYVYRSEDDGSGGYTVGFTMNMAQVVGTGLTSGATYLLVGVYTYQEHSGGPFPQTINREFRRRWISVGRSPDAYVYGQYRLTIDAQGELQHFETEPWSVFAPSCTG